MLLFFTYLIALYLLISIAIAGNAQVLGEFLVSLLVMAFAIILIFHYLL